jgi:prevent-host-death family protein
MQSLSCTDIDDGTEFGLYLVQSHIVSEIAEMKLSTQIKPISHLKAHTAEVVRQLTEQREPLVITQNGEAKVVIQDIKSYEETQETLALLKILALGNRQIEEAKVHPAAEVIARLRKKERA